jgi:IS30 family transposase
MGKRRWHKLPSEVRREVIRMASRGASYRQIIDELDVGLAVVGRVLRPLGGVIRVEDWKPSPARLSLDERVEITLGLERGLSFRSIGESVGRHASTIWREVNANGGRVGYRPMSAHERAGRAARRPKTTKLGVNRVDVAAKLTP